MNCISCKIKLNFLLKTIKTIEKTGGTVSDNNYIIYSLVKIKPKDVRLLAVNVIHKVKFRAKT